MFDMNSFRLDGKVALVTGASYGIGFAIASGFAKAGAKIVFNDIKQELVDKGMAAYKEAGIEAKGYVCDVTNEEAVAQMVAAIEKTHEERYRALLSNVEMQKVFEKAEETMWECRNCGHLVMGKKAPEVCPVCAHPQAYFEVRKENY